MSTMNGRSDPFSDDDLPPDLLSDLRGTQRTPTVPEAVDRRVLADARAYLGRQRRIRLWGRTLGGVAAAILVAAGIRLATGPWSGPAPSPQMAMEQPAAPQASAAVRLLPQDIDRSGTVDILDAFAVARGLKSGLQSVGWDTNGDGIVNQRDVDQIAAAAVRVKGGVQ